MPSHLTRLVFRRLLANEPLVHRGCLLRSRTYGSLPCHSSIVSAGTRCNACVKHYKEQRRSFLDLNMFRTSSRREVKEVDIDPGLEKMMELAKMERMRARLPPVGDVVDAFQQFFKSKLKSKQPVEDNQAQLALQSLKYCLRPLDKKDWSSEFNEKRLHPRDLIDAATIMKNKPITPTDAHVALASELFSALRAIADRNAIELGRWAYVVVLCYSGSSTRARELLLEAEKTLNSSKSASANTVAFDEEASGEEEIAEEVAGTPSRGSATQWRIKRGWTAVLEGFARENNREELLRTLDMCGQRGIIDSNAVVILLNFYLVQNDVESIKHWWMHYRRWQLQRGAQVSAKQVDTIAQELDRVLQWCVANGQLDMGHEIVSDFMVPNPPKSAWDAILIWAAGTGKGPDEINRMIGVMEKSNETLQDPSEWRVADIATINRLVEFAVSKNDPYMAERFISIGRHRGLEPNALTYVLQMDYRLRVNDVDGALVAYKNLQAEDLSAKEDVPTVNRLIVALCETQRHDFDTIMNVVGDLTDRNARFEPTTVATLSVLHLSRGEHHDVSDLLNTHAFHYSTAQRVIVRDALVDFALNPRTNISRAWDAYTTLRAVFDETPRDPRTELMRSFFRRGRSDMGVHIFQNMRMHSRADTIPTVETYVAAFMAVAQLRDLENLEVVHNQLKLDFNIEVTTYVRNALIIAYTACGEPRRALDFWDELVTSREGPSFNSIHVAMRACEEAPFGDLKAQEIWSILRRCGIEMDQSLWGSYVAALAGNGDNQLAISTLEAAAKKGEVQVDAFVVGSLFAGAAGQVKQEEVESWARERCPAAWQELEGLGVDVDELGMRSFKIDRKVGP